MGKQLVFILFFFLNLLIHNAYAYNLKQVADKEYMSNSSITSLCQDERGLMWIGTCDGLFMMDRRLRNLRLVTKRITYLVI